MCIDDNSWNESLQKTGRQHWLSFDLWNLLSLTCFKILIMMWSKLFLTCSRIQILIHIVKWPLSYLLHDINTDPHCRWTLSHLLWDTDTDPHSSLLQTERRCSVSPPYSHPPPHIKYSRRRKRWKRRKRCRTPVSLGGGQSRGGWDTTSSRCSGRTPPAPQRMGLLRRGAPSLSCHFLWGKDQKTTNTMK